jgi:magnesium transporter
MKKTAGFRVLDIPASGPATTSEGDAQVAPPPEGAVRWIDLAGQDAAALELLGRRFDFHPLTLEDCQHFDQRPKLEEYGSYLFLVVHGFAVDPDGGVRPLELHAFLGQRYLVTVHAEPMPALETIWQRVAVDPGLGRRGADFIYYLVVDDIVDQNFVHLDAISDTLDDIEEAVLSRAERRDLASIFALKRKLVTMRRVLSPQRDVFALLAKRGDARISERTSFYFRDVYDHLTRIYESIDTGRDLLGNALDAYLSMVAQRTNDIVKRLTIFTVVFMPLTFLTGFFGQNFDALPIHSAWLFYAVCASCLVVPVGMLIWFRRSGWL